jgi:hypothetical protein
VIPVVLRCELQRVVDVEGEHLPVRLLLTEAEESLDVRPTVRAVDPRHRGTPLKLGGLRCVGEHLPGPEQSLDVHAVVDQ